MSLSPDELTRYSRHLALPEVGQEGQERLRAARILIVGAGGLGSPAALYLAAAGVGTLGIAEFDRVDLSNLQRQILHGTGAVGLLKLDSAAARLTDLNPSVRLELHPVRVSEENVLALVSGYDLVLDGSDNFPTRYLVNDAAVLAARPLVYASIFRFEGQLSLLGAPGGPCYRCLYPDPPAPGLVPNCAEAGVLGVLPGVIGTLQAAEAVKWILGIGRPLVGRLLLYDGLEAGFREIAVRRDPACPVCGSAPSITSPRDSALRCGAGSGLGDGEIEPGELAVLRSRNHRLLLIDVREPWEMGVASITGARAIPLAELTARLAELDRDAEIVTFCHRGQRSIAARELLTEAGFRARSLAGGIDAWSRIVDPEIPRY